MGYIDFDKLVAPTLTSIRRTWSVEKLEAMAAEGHETPASGDDMFEPALRAPFYGSRDEGGM